MKNESNVSVWSLMGLIFLGGMLGLFVSLSVLASDSTTVDINPEYAVQHIESVRIMQADNVGDDVIISSDGAGLLKIQTNSNILLGNDNKIVDGGTNSTILGGINNVITGGQDSTIIAGASNIIDNSGGGGSNTILGGQGNEIEGSSSFSTIAGGLRNRIVGMLSTIVGGADNQINGDYSVIVGNENVVVGNNSVAVGKNSIVNANNSFLWTDSTKNGQLNADGVFAVVSRRGMVVNSLAPNQYAQLTIGGPLVVGMNNNDVNAVCGTGQGGGTMKTIFTGGRYCLCSCDGNSRNSMFGQGECQSVCHSEAMQPICGTEVSRIQCGEIYKFRGTCEAGYVVEGTGAYLVDSNNVVHWTCHTSAGARVSCSSAVTETIGCPAPCPTPWPGSETIPDGESIIAYLSNNPAGTCDGIIRTCHNGTLDGNSSYNAQSCTNGCKKPWNNDYIADGASLTAYETSSVPYGSTCVSHERVCDNTELSGIGEYENCVVQEIGSCSHNGLWYPHGTELVTYDQNSYQCPDGCNNGGHAITGKCQNGMWMSGDSQVTLNYYTRCDSQNSSNASTYTLSSCPSDGTCLSGTVSLGGEDPNNSCTTMTKYALDKCNAGFYKSGDVCITCPTGYTSNTGASSYGCIIRCGDAQYLSGIGDASCTACPAGTYITGHTVNYGSKSSCYPCGNGPMHSHYTSNSTGNNCSWVCDAGFNKVGNECVGSCGTYSPSAFKVLDMYFLTDSGTTGHYALMDRNLGATQVYAGIDNICTYGYYYQWGNNYGFANAGSIKTSTEKVDALPYGPSPLNYYSSDTFIKTSQDWSINQNDNLWGGNGSVIDRRGPCPEGYHIPSSSEFRNIIDNYWGKSVYNTGGSQLALDFLMPFAGFRASNSNVVSQGSTGAYWYSSWSISHPGRSVHLWFHRSVVPVNSSPRPDGMSIRCARNSQDSALTIHPNEGKKALIVVHDNKITKLGTPTRDGKIFGGWYWDAGYTLSAYTGQTVPASAHLYAKWN